MEPVDGPGAACVARTEGLDHRRERIALLDAGQKQATVFAFQHQLARQQAFPILRRNIQALAAHSGLEFKPVRLAGGLDQQFHHGRTHPGDAFIDPQGDAPALAQVRQLIQQLTTGTHLDGIQAGTEN